MTHEIYNKIARIAINAALDAAQAIRNHSFNMIDLIDYSQTCCIAEQIAYTKLNKIQADNQKLEIV